MVMELTLSERRVALLGLGFLSLVGLLIAGAGNNDPVGVHGFILFLLAVAACFPLLSGCFEPEPDEARLGSYYDTPTKLGIVLAMGWALFALFIGDWVAWQLVEPNLTFDAW